MTRATQFVVAAVAVAFGLGAWRVFDSTGSALPPDRVPIVVEDDLIQVGGSLGDFDVAGDRMILSATACKDIVPDYATFPSYMEASMKEHLAAPAEEPKTTKAS